MKKTTMISFLLTGVVVLLLFALLLVPRIIGKRGQSQQTEGQQTMSTASPLMESHEAVPLTETPTPLPTATPTPMISEAPKPTSTLIEPTILTPPPTPTPTETPTPTPTPTPEPVEFNPVSSFQNDTDTSYYWPYSDSQLYSESDLMGLTAEQIGFVKNEIYARRGYTFKSEKYASYFGWKKWYHPTVSSADFTDAMLNDTERANVRMIEAFLEAHPDGGVTPTPTPTPTPAPTEAPTPAPTQAPAAAGDYIWPESNSRLYSPSDLDGKSSQEIRLILNEIYARHGYIFKNETYSSYFSSKSWYTPSVPGDQFNEGVLNDVERANINMILEYEQSH